MGKAMSAADGYDFGTAFQIPPLIENIDQFTFMFGKKKGDEGNDHFPYAQNNQDNAADENNNAEGADQRIGSGRKNSA